MHKLLSAALVVTAITNPAMAAMDLATYDTNKDRLLSRSERNAIKRDLAPLGTTEAAHWLDTIEKLEVELNNQQFIPLAEVAGVAYTERLKCDLQQRFFLRDSIDNLPFLQCQELWPKSSGASFNYTGDFKSNKDKIDIDGVLGISLITPGTFVQHPRDRKPGFVLSDFALLAFAEASGTINLGDTDKGYSRLGTNAYAWTEDGPFFERTAWDFSAYYQSDLEFGGNGYGIQLSVTPEQSDWYLNSYVRAENSHQIFFWTAHARIDVLHIDNPGVNNLTNDTDYAWIGGRFGFVYEDKPAIWKNGINLKANVRYYYDLVGDQEAFQLNTTLDFNLDEKGSSSFGLGYTLGKTRQDLISKDKVIMSLKFKI